jgi:hypothetical protein
MKARADTVDHSPECAIAKAEGQGGLIQARNQIGIKAHAACRFDQVFPVGGDSTACAAMHRQKRLSKLVRM